MGKLSVVGIGPGDYENMTVRADRALEGSQVIVGYSVYVDLVKDRYPGKEYRPTGMTREADRCRMALDLAREALPEELLQKQFDGIRIVYSKAVTLKDEVTAQYTARDGASVVAILANGAVCAIVEFQ